MYMSWSSSYNWCTRFGTTTRALSLPSGSAHMSSTARAASCFSTACSLAKRPLTACSAPASMAAFLPSACPQRLTSVLRASALCRRRLSVKTTNGMMSTWSASSMAFSALRRFERAASRTSTRPGVAIVDRTSEIASSARTILTTTLPSDTLSATSSRPSMLCVSTSRVFPAANRTSAESRSSNMNARLSAHPLSQIALRPWINIANRPNACAAPFRTSASASLRSSFRRATFSFPFSPASESPITV
mmetsp:Transcript_439/g.901  ORF Transcript_439/g.901 Transcript_439/m.901 type:complete len:247 (+) Transcript_439:215-955(+)